MKIEEFILELLNKGIPITGVTQYALSLNGTKVIGYEIPGFSKSGNVTLYENKIGEIWSVARYNSFIKITSFNDLVYLAWDWYDSYSDRSPFENPSEIWEPYFLEMGLLKKVTEVKYVKTK